MDDGFGQPLWESATNYANNGKSWMKDFIKSFIKMQSNGNKNLLKGPTNFWSERCCLMDLVRPDGPDLETINNIKDPMECQKRCQAKGQSCAAFSWNRQWDPVKGKVCSLKSAIDSYSYSGINFGYKGIDPTISGPRICPAGRDFCAGFERK